MVECYGIVLRSMFRPADDAICEGINPLLRCESVGLQEKVNQISTRTEPCNRRTATIHAYVSTSRALSLAGADKLGRGVGLDSRFDLSRSAHAAFITKPVRETSSQLWRKIISIISYFRLRCIPDGGNACSAHGDNATPAVPSQPSHARSSKPRHVWQNRKPTPDNNPHPCHPLTHPTTHTPSPVHRIIHTYTPLP